MSNLIQGPFCLMVMQGGLGNQLFQLLAGIEYARKYDKKLYLITASNRRPYYWDTVLSKYADLVIDITRVPDDTYLHVEQKNSYQPLPLVPGNISFYGYFQSMKYFPSITNILELLDLKVTPLAENIVIVHARRGDYLLHSDIHPVQSERYYSDAAAVMASMVKDPYFILLSDETQYWTDHAATVFEGYGHAIWGDDNEVTTLAMMAGASNFIIANSTYSWWGAVLANAKNVIAPEKWYGDGRDASDLYLDHWIRL